MTFAYQFTSTAEDLLEAELAERSIYVRGPLRGALTTLALAGIAGAIWAFVHQQFWPSLVWLCVALAFLQWSVVRPYQRRHRIKRDNALARQVSVAFDDNGLNIQIDGVGRFSREWNELVATADTDKGILFYFSDGVKNWLPNRVFLNDREQRSLLEFINRHQQRSCSQ